PSLCCTAAARWYSALRPFPPRRPSDLICPRQERTAGERWLVLARRPSSRRQSYEKHRLRTDSEKSPSCDPRSASAALFPLLIDRSEEHTSELQSREKLVCRLLLEKKKH